MADQQSIELLALNSATGTIANRRFAKRLSRSLSTFPNFNREYLNAVIKVHQCAQYADDICIDANTPRQMIANLRAVFRCLGKTGRKLSIAKCHFGVKEVDFFGHTKTTNGVPPQKENITNFMAKGEFPRSKNALQGFIAFLNYYPNYILRLAQRLTPFFQLLK